jgi:hypothetical protein
LQDIDSFLGLDFASLMCALQISLLSKVKPSVGGVRGFNLENTMDSDIPLPKKINLLL